MKRQIIAALGEVERLEAELFETRRPFLERFARLMLSREQLTEITALQMKVQKEHVILGVSGWRYYHNSLKKTILSRSRNYTVNVPWMLIERPDLLRTWYARQVERGLVTPIDDPEVFLLLSDPPQDSDEAFDQGRTR